MLFPDDPQAIVALGFLAAGPWDESSLTRIVDDTIDKKIAQVLDRDDMVTTVMSTFTSTTVHCARCHDHKFDPISQADYYSLQAVFAGVDRADRLFDPDPAVHRRGSSWLTRKARGRPPGPPERLLADPRCRPNWPRPKTSFAAVARCWTVLVPPVDVDGQRLDRRRRSPTVRSCSAARGPTTDTYTLTLRDRRCDGDHRGPARGADRRRACRTQGPGRQDNGNLHLTEFKLSAARHRRQRARERADRRRVGRLQSGRLGRRGRASTASARPPGASIPRWASRMRPSSCWPNRCDAAGPTRLTGRARATARPRPPDRPAADLGDHGRRNPAAGRPTPGGDRGDLWPSRRPSATPAQQCRAGPLAARLAGWIANWRRCRRRRRCIAACQRLQSRRQFPAGRQAAADPRAAPRRHQPAARGSGARRAGVRAGPRVAVRTAGTRRRGAPPRRAGRAGWSIRRTCSPGDRSSIASGTTTSAAASSTRPTTSAAWAASRRTRELLDWLAVEFRDGGGSLKKLHRLIVTSAAYRQSSQIDAERSRSRRRQPLLWRMNRTRLDAESIRDAVLQVSGKLDLTMGGPSVKQFVQIAGHPRHAGRRLPELRRRRSGQLPPHGLSLPVPHAARPVHGIAGLSRRLAACAGPERVGDGAAGAGAAQRPVHRAPERAHGRAAGRRPRRTCPSRSGRCSSWRCCATRRRRKTALASLRRTARTGQRLPDDVQQQRIHVRQLSLCPVAETHAVLRSPRNTADHSALAARSAAVRLGGGFGGIAAGAHAVRAATGSLADAGRRRAGDLTLNGGLHHRAKVKRVIQLFMNGGVSQMDTFDYKPGWPSCTARRSTRAATSKLEAVTGSPGFKVLKSPFAFKQHGQSRPLGQQRVSAPGRLRRRPGLPDGDGLEDQRPRPGQLHAEHRLRAARLSLHGRLAHLRPGQPDATTCRRSSSCPTPRPALQQPRAISRRASCRSRTRARSFAPHLPNPIADLFPPERRPRYITPDSERDGLALLAQAEPRPTRGSGRATRGSKRGSPPTSWPPGCSSARPRRSTCRAKPPRRTSCTASTTTRPRRFGRNCLIARRLLERGVRFVQVWSGARRADEQLGQPRQHPERTAADRPGDRSADRGAGRRPRRRAACSRTRWSSGPPSSAACRSPRARPAAITTAARSSPGWPAPASSAGVAYGESDEWAWKPPKPTYCYDLHATILHLLGIDHTRLTFRHNGIDRRLTDVHGHVIHEILA